MTFPASGGPEAAFTLDDLTLGYGSQPALRGVSGTIERGDLLALVGPNGAGKSTFLKGLMGEARILGGALHRHGVASSAIAYLPQRAELDLAFPICVTDFATIGLWRTIGAFRRVDRVGRDRVRTALARVGLEGLGSRPVDTLSGGQLQRVLFARTVVENADVILLDEPFAAVDARTVEDLLGVIRDWHREGRTVVAALHDLGQVRAHFPRCLLLARDPIAWGPTEVVLSQANLARTGHLVQAWDAPDPACGERPARPRRAAAP